MCNLFTKFTLIIYHDRDGRCVTGNGSYTGHGAHNISHMRGGAHVLMENMRSNMFPTQSIDICHAESAHNNHMQLGTQCQFASCTFVTLLMCKHGNNINLHENS